jgi:hypothetical protein
MQYAVFQYVGSTGFISELEHVSAINYILYKSVTSLKRQPTLGNMCISICRQRKESNAIRSS